MPLGMLGKYERLDVLGHGASGIVYLAKDTLLSRQVALKEVAAQGDDKERILGEARVLDRLRHPNIVQVIGVDEIDGKVVIAMEYVRGHSLLEILRETPRLAVADTVSIAAQVCDGLAYAHAHRTVHRDIKPANILVDRDGVVKLVDFGLAEVLGTHSFAGGAGTYAYMAPEDFHEEEHSDRQSDIWAVGVVLYEMLAGRRPFQAGKAKDPFAWRRAIEEDAIEPLSALRADIPPELDAIVAHALARSKRERYADAALMASDLRALTVEAESIPAAAPAAPDGTAERVLPDMPPMADIDGFLDLAPDYWTEARAALVGGALARWLREIGEAPLAEVAQEIATEPAREDDDRLRDFLYRAGLETIQEARRCFAEGDRLYKAGRFDEAVRLLRRAARLDPSRPPHHQLLARALRATGDAAGAALALEYGLVHHPAQRVLEKARADVTGAEVMLSADRIDFGALRQGQTRTASITVRNGGQGVLEGHIASTPAWLRVTPSSFATRQRQPLRLTADTSGVWQAPASYQEAVVLETSGGRREIIVSASVLAARRGLAQVAHWYLPLLFCCVLPALMPWLAGVFMSLFGWLEPHHAAVLSSLRHLEQPGMVAGGLLCGAAFVLAFSADLTWPLRILPIGLLCLFIAGFTGIVSSLYSPGEGLARAALVQTAIPVLVLIVLQAVAVAADPQGWGRWQLWRWIVGATGLLVSYALMHVR